MKDLLERYESLSETVSLYDSFHLHRLGIWLFMSGMPYGTLSSTMLWKVLYVMQCAETAGLETLRATADTQSCLQALRGIIPYAHDQVLQVCDPQSIATFADTFFFSLLDPKHQERFEQWLCEVNSSDGISLLTALAHMATPTQHSDSAFITTITLLIYQV